MGFLSMFQEIIMKKIIISTVLAISAATSAHAGEAPEIQSALAVPNTLTGEVTISGMVSDPDFDADRVAPIPVGICLPSLLPNVVGNFYTCVVPLQGNSGDTITLTLVAGDSEDNYSEPYYVTYTTP